MIGEGIDYEKGLYDPEGKGVLNLVDDQFARDIIFSQLDKGKTFGYDIPPNPDNGDFAQLEPNPGTGGGDSEIEPSYL